MKAFNDNVDEFNQYVSAQVEDLAAGGQTSDDLLVYLFRSYLVVKDNSFRAYMQRKKELYDERGNVPMPPEELMDLALTKYLQLKQEGTWKAKSKEEEQIIALTAKLKEAQDTLHSLKSASSDKPNSGSSNSGNSGKKKDKKKDKDNKGISAWKKVRPKGGEGTLERNGKKYKWCDHHHYYTISHATKECTMSDEEKKERKAKRESSNEDKKLKLTANVAIEEDDSSNSNSFHDE